MTIDPSDIEAHQNECAKRRRENWGEGPWLKEPDRVEFKTAAGYPGLVVRNNVLGHLCGYVGLPPGHPWHGLDCDKIHDARPELMVHGGLTYTDECRWIICHVPEPGEPDSLWWIGFDCGHSDDTSPGLVFGSKAWRPSKEFSELYLRLGGTYKDLKYVMGEVEDLARQAHEAHR